MFAAVLLFLVSLIGLIGALNALRGPATDRHPGLRPPFLPALFTAEAVPVRVDSLGNVSEIGLLLRQAADGTISRLIVSGLPQ